MKDSRSRNISSPSSEPPTKRTVSHVVDRHVAERFAGEVENLDFGLEVSQVGDKDSISAHGPVLNRHVTGGNDVDKLNFCIFALPNLDNLQVGSIPVGDGEDTADSSGVAAQICTAHSESLASAGLAPSSSQT